MYDAVPEIVPVAVCVRSTSTSMACVATPKSSSFTVPFAVTRMFAGFRSR
jgi:hypothetical protein